MATNQADTANEGKNGSSAEGGRSLGKGRGVVRMQTSGKFGLPSQFFQSREEIRTWGAEKVVDPSILPTDEYGVTPKPFNVPLPGYAPKQCERAYDSRVGPMRANRDQTLGPDLSYNNPPLYLPQYKSNPKFKEQAIGYNWENEESYEMDTKPYVHAIFDPIDPALLSMYSQNCPWSAYAYGVPR